MKKIFTLFSAMFLTASAFAQIPNASFETWVSGGAGAYEDPTSWGTANATINSLPLTGLQYTCEKGTTGAPDGTAFLKLTSKTVATSVAPGIAVTGTLDVNLTAMTFNVTGGFPTATRHASLTGKWQHMGSGAEHGRVLVFLSKWNATLLKRDTVAMADTTLTGMAMSWSDFTIPMKYKSSSLTPDTGMVVLLSSSNPSTAVNGSYLYVDKLAFSGTVPAGVNSVSALDAATSIYPNPATGSASVYYHSTAGKNMTITLADITGKALKTTNVRAVAGENSFPLDVKGLAQGMYLVQLIDENSVIQRKLVIE